MSELILQTRDLTRRYGHTLALDHAALSVEKGQIFGLVGRNGAGKTTLIRLISGQSHPTAGEVTLFGASTPAALARARSLVGLKGYVTNIPSCLMGAGEVVSSYHELWHARAVLRR